MESAWSYACKLSKTIIAAVGIVHLVYFGVGPRLYATAILSVTHQRYDDTSHGIRYVFTAMDGVIDLLVAFFKFHEFLDSNLCLLCSIHF
jgi:hypothetical protein